MRVHADGPSLTALRSLFADSSKPAGHDNPEVSCLVTRAKWHLLNRVYGSLPDILNEIQYLRSENQRMSQAIELGKSSSVAWSSALSGTVGPRGKRSETDGLAPVASDGVVDG